VGDQSVAGDLDSVEEEALRRQEADQQGDGSARCVSGPIEQGRRNHGARGQKSHGSPLVERFDGPRPAQSRDHPAQGSRGSLSCVPRYPIAPDAPEQDTYIVLAQQATSLDPLVRLPQQCRWNHEPWRFSSP